MADELPDAPWSAPPPAELPNAPWPQKPENPISQGRAFVVGAQQGAMANFADELKGASAASGLPNWVPEFVPGTPIPLKTIVGAGRVAGEALAGKPAEGTAVYEATRDAARKETKAAQEQHPWTTLAGNAVGAIAVPVPALGAGSMAARVGKSAVTGAGYGAAYGAGEGETLQDRADKAVTGAGVGSVAGAAAPVVLKGIEAGAQGVGSLVAPAFQKFRGSVDPEAEAAKRLTQAAQKHFEDRGTPLTAEQIDVLNQVGNPQAILDILGERGYAIARSAANQSPEAREILKNFIEPRFEAQSERAMEFVRSLVNTPANAVQTREALASVNPTLSPLYRKAYADGADGILDRELSEIASSSIMAPVVRDAAIAVESKMVTGRASHPLAHVDPYTGNGIPTLEFWDQVKRTLDSKINVAKRQGDKELAADLNAIRSRIVEKLDDAVPSYGVARGVAHEFFKSNDALEAGEKFLTGKMKNADARKAVTKMSPEERELFAEGYASELVNRLGSTGDRRSILASIQSSPAARERMEIALGKQGAEKFQTYLQVESIMDRARTAMQNSTTARQLVELGLAGGASGLALGDFSPQNLVTGALLWKGLRVGSTMAQNRLASQTSRNLAEQTARMLVSNDPAVLRKGIEALNRNPRFKQALKSFDDDLAKIASQHQPGVQPSRAEDENRSERTPEKHDGGQVSGPERFANGGRVVASNINHAPTEAQKEAGNYAKDHVRILGLDLTIENAKGKYRRGVDRDGKPWAVRMPAHYGYIKGSVGADKDHVDVYVGPATKSPSVFVVDQKDADTGKFDEHKAFIGFASKAQVVATYRKGFSDGKADQRLGHIAEMTVDQFKQWLESGDTTKPVANRADGGRVSEQFPWVSQGGLSPHEAAAMRVRRSARPPRGRQEGLATKVPEAIASGIAKSAVDAFQFPGRYARGETGYAPGQMASEQPEATTWAPEMGLNMVGAPGLTGGVPGMGSGIRAYHGSPHDFDKFDLKKIGTGEGAQVYGHGLYFAENEKVARGYRDDLTRANSDLLRDYYANYSPVDDATKIAKAALLRDGDPVNARFVAQNWQMPSNVERAEVLKKIDEIAAAFPKPQGRMYEVNINAAPEEFLAWDRHIGEQSPAVAAALDRVDQPMFDAWKKSGAWPHVRGETAYRDLAKGLTNKAHDEGAHIVASEKLKDVGIPGIKYFDQGSRPPGTLRMLSPKESVSGKWTVGIAPNGPNHRFDTEEAARAFLAQEEARRTSNYVVFDDKIIDILRKYGIALPGGGVALDMARMNAEQNQ